MRLLCHLVPASELHLRLEVVNIRFGLTPLVRMRSTDGSDPCWPSIHALKVFGVSLHGQIEPLRVPDSQDQWRIRFAQRKS